MGRDDRGRDVNKKQLEGSKSCSDLSLVQVSAWFRSPNQAYLSVSVKFTEVRPVLEAVMVTIPDFDPAV